ncbi:iron complex transport system substrate-binding protein [Actinopolyspora xinjiangensis]|uniref:Iron complex transport system substrate-binding protein n=1 Tax=Actinopolyspora xinjiangensis TaxID=405564 RepID=A0A1H0THX5_9ACTN|nr:iron-siderophore ABC transporter substrate-binding protein [Actinopolyspora xinjiangensis]SDP53445.1 iron complex transport system substrate-binding protein [Actinopolyspora xinjiangensis]
MPRDKFGPARSEISRRGLLGGAGVLLLTACAPGKGSGGSGSGSGSGSGAFPVRIEHKHGTTEIPERPERVVTVGLTDQDTVLALGTAPVATREWFGGKDGALWPWAREKLGDREMPEVLARQELEFERIAALEPDVIIGVNSGLKKQEYDKLSKIAPTVAQPAEFADYGVPWQDMTRIIGKALGSSEKAEQLVTDIEGRFAEARSRHPEFDGATGLLATSISGQAWVYAEGPAPRLLRSLGFQLPSATERLFSGENREPQQLSKERLGLLEADVLLLGVYGAPEDSIARKQVYQQLDVAKQGRDIRMPRQTALNGAVSFSSPLSLPTALDGLVPRLAAAIDGDPSTEVRPVK